MKTLSSSLKRPLAAALAAVMVISACGPALAAGEEIAPTCDETYYATLDYYGGLDTSSVVKTYRTYGSDKITDYGVYDKITNLTDDREAVVNNGGVTFDLTGDVPEKLYFECESAQPYDEFPWQIAVSYKLNGVPTPADRLAGEKGVVEITLDAVPNPKCSEYNRNNLVLMAASMFNGDDILSLSAEGAQVQLIGNLYCVIYAVLPGEEQHFTFSVGSESFSYSGMMLMAVPGTLAQLEQIKTLREVKEDTEDSLNAISDSLDIMLSTLDGMGGSLSAAASGLDALNQARGIISNNKDSLYDSIDTAVDASNRLSASLDPLPDHLTNASAAFNESVDLLNDMNDNITSLSPEVENCRKILKNLKSDLDDLQDALDDYDDEGAREASDIAVALSSDFKALGKVMDNLKAMSSSMGGGLSDLQASLGSIDDSDEKYVTINGMRVEQIQAYVPTVTQLRQAYEATPGAADTMTFEQFITGYLTQNPAAVPAGMDAAAAAHLLNMVYTASTDGSLDKAAQLNETLAKMDITVNELKKLVSEADGSLSPIVKQLYSLCDVLGSRNLSGDLEDACLLLDDAIGSISSNDMSSALGSLKDACALGERIMPDLDTGISQLDEMNAIVNKYQPGVTKMLDEGRETSRALADCMEGLSGAATTAENMLKDSGSHLDSGMNKTLSNLSSVLRKAAQGLNQTSTVRTAKDSVETMVRDQWDQHAGEVDNLLMIDSTARPQSMTDERNENVTSIQYVMRTHEITLDSGEEEEEAEKTAVKTTFWQRVGNMFSDIWHSITGIFKK